MARSVTGWKGNHPLEFMPCLVRWAADRAIRKITLGHPLLDAYLVFVAARARTSTWLAVAYHAMVLGGLRRCEVPGLRLEDLSVGERRLFVAEGQGGRQRVVPVSARFFAAVGAYLESERPAAAATRQVFVVLKGARRGEPLSAAGLDEILDGARSRAGLEPGNPPPVAPHLFHPAAKARSCIRCIIPPNA